MGMVCCDDDGDASGEPSADRGVGGVTIGSPAPLGGDPPDRPDPDPDPGAFGGDPDFRGVVELGLPSLSPAEAKRTRPAAKTRGLSRVTVGRAGLGLFASRSIKSAASVVSVSAARPDTLAPWL